MKILVIGSTSNLEELRQKFGAQHVYRLGEPERNMVELIKDVDVIFDFSPDKDFIKSQYSNFTNPVFLNTSFITLSRLMDHADFLQADSFFGFCGLPTFVNRSVLEVSMSTMKNEIRLKATCSQLATDFVCVEDRVGMVTPRVICMIINEAFYTLEEGIATREAIDLAMKTGTNYPYGPFEWAKRIGIMNVIELLDAVYRDTLDDRYKVCDLFRRELKDRD